MNKITVNSPCVVKLFGEHAVVHGKTAVAIGIGLYATATFEIEEQRLFKILLIDLKKEISVDEKLLSNVYEKYIKKESIDSYIKENLSIDKDILPYITILSISYCKYNCIISGQIKVTSKIPKQSGLASSASCYTAVTVAILKANEKTLSDEECIDLARNGERVSHKNEGAGRIDVSTAYYGGYVSFSGTEFTKHKLKARPNLLIINTGPKLPTSETVGRVTKLLKEKKEYAEGILNKINECSVKGLEYLYKNEFENVGKIMYENHELLKLLEVSSEKLDKAVSIARKHKAHGAKLSGGGGGGVAVAILEVHNPILEKELSDEGFVCIKTEISENGAKDMISK